MGLFKTKSCHIKTETVELNCVGYTSEEVLTIFKDIALGMTNNITEKIDFSDLEPEGDLNEYVSTEGKDTEIINLDRTLKTVKLPSCTANFTCPNCKQSVLLKVKDQILVRDPKRNKVYDIGTVGLPNIDSDNLIDVYKDCLELIVETKDYILVSDSDDRCSCPVCDHEDTIKEFVSHYEDNNSCDFCGLERENVISQDGEFNDCSNKCSMKLSNK